MAGVMAMVHPSADVASDALIGDGTQVWSNVQIRSGAVIGRNCILGRQCFVDVDVHVGDNVKIQNNAELYEGVSVADGVFIGPHVVFTNDRVPRAVNPDGSLKGRVDWELGRTHVEYGAALGACSTIITGVTIGRWALVGSGAVVTRDVPDHALVVGNPASIVGYVSAAGTRCAEQAEAIELSEREAAGGPS